MLILRAGGGFALVYAPFDGNNVTVVTAVPAVATNDSVTTQDL